MRFVTMCLHVSETIVSKCLIQSRYLVLHVRFIGLIFTMTVTLQSTISIIFWVLLFRVLLVLFLQLLLWRKSYPTPQQELANLHFSSVVKKKEDKYETEIIYSLQSLNICYMALYRKNVPVLALENKICIVDLLHSHLKIKYFNTSQTMQKSYNGLSPFFPPTLRTILVSTSTPLPQQLQNRNLYFNKAPPLDSYALSNLRNNNLANIGRTISYTCGSSPAVQSLFFFESQ